MTTSEEIKSGIFKEAQDLALMWAEIVRKQPRDEGLDPIMDFTQKSIAFLFVQAALNSMVLEKLGTKIDEILDRAGREAEVKRGTDEFSGKLRRRETPN